MMAIRFDRVSKAYDLQVGRYNIFSALKSATGRPVSNELFYALSEVTFDVESGQTVGGIGREGEEHHAQTDRRDHFPERGNRARRRQGVFIDRARGRLSPGVDGT